MRLTNEPDALDNQVFTARVSRACRSPSVRLFFGGASIRSGASSFARANSLACAVF